ncbi:MAG: cell division protein FtsW [Bdellovibrionaceae bacterium]|jgi:cell division protein FtsW|nr:cell division protein FtsW [Pseudobdellovibrionaceae bacterium]
MKFKETDLSLLLVAFFFLGFGLVQVYSSSYIFAIESYGDGLFFFKKQFFAVVIGLAIIATCYFLNWKQLSRVGLSLWVLAVIGVLLTFVPSLGVKVGGATRWLSLPGGLRFEPSELLKVSYPFVVGYWINWLKKERLLRSKILVVALLCWPFYFLLKQPDFGTVVICGASLFYVHFAFGMRIKTVLAFALTTVPAFYFLVMQVGYRYDRVKSFLDPWSDPSNSGFQAIQSMLSFHSGGLFGRGLGQGQGKLYFLPEAHTDFTFAVLGEEWGFIGVLAILFLFAFFIYRGFRIVVHSKNTYSMSVALGLIITFTLSVVINMGVVMGLLPTKGLTLPFLSYGGSSLVSVCFLVGVLINISSESKNMVKKNSNRFMRVS